MLARRHPGPVQRRALLAGAAAVAYPGIRQAAQDAVRLGRRAREWVDANIRPAARRRLDFQAAAAPPVAAAANVNSMAKPSTKKAGRRRRNASKGRRTVRKRVLSVRKRRGKRSRGTSRRALLLKLAAPNTLTFASADKCFVPSNNAALTTLGKPAIFFVPSDYVLDKTGTGNLLPLGSSMSLMNTAVLRDIQNRLDSSSSTATTNFDRRFYLCKNYLSYTLVNMSNAHANLTLYRLQVRRDIPLDPTTGYTYRIDDLLKAGWDLQGHNASIAASIQSNWMAVADDVPLEANTAFLQHFRIVKKRKIDLEPGIEHKFSLAAPKRTFNCSRLFIAGKIAGTTTTTNPALSYMQGDQLYLFRLSGTIVDESSTHNVGFSAPNVDFHCKRVVVYKHIDDNAATVIRENPINFTNWSTNAAVFIDEKTNTLVNEVEA